MTAVDERRIAELEHLRGVQMVPIADEFVPRLREGVGPVWVQLVDDDDGDPMLVLTHVAPNQATETVREAVAAENFNICDDEEEIFQHG